MLYYAGEAGEAGIGYTAPFAALPAYCVHPDCCISTCSFIPWRCECEYSIDGWVQSGASFDGWVGTYDLSCYKNAAHFNVRSLRCR